MRFPYCKTDNLPPFWGDLGWGRYNLLSAGDSLPWYPWYPAWPHLDWLLYLIYGSFGKNIIHWNIVFLSCGIQINLHLTTCLIGLSESYWSFLKAGYQPYCNFHEFISFGTCSQLPHNSSKIPYNWLISCTYCWWFRIQTLVVWYFSHQHGNLRVPPQPDPSRNKALLSDY